MKVRGRKRESERSRREDFVYFLTAHEDVCSILRNRLKLLQEVRSQWSLSEPKV